MSRIERIFKRSSLKDFEKALEKALHQASLPGFSSEADKLGLPRCPGCNSPLLMGFGDSSGDYLLCVKCGAVVFVELGNG